MNKYTLGIFAHANAGKTTLTEHLLFKAGIIQNIGRVDNGNTVTDDLSVEKSRGITVRSSLVSFMAKNNLFYLLDTPGHIDFISEVEKAIPVLDVAILVISGVEKVEAQTHDIFNALIQNKIPTIIFINKLDRNGANLNETITDIKKIFKVNTLQITDYISNKTTMLKDSELIEQLCSYSDSVLEKYLNNAYNSKNILNDIIELFKNATAYPIFCGSSLNDVGVNEVFNFLECLTLNKNYLNEQSLYAFQTRFDGLTQNIYVKNYGTNVVCKQSVFIDEEKYKLDNIFIPKGANLEKSDLIETGDIAVIKALDIPYGTWIGTKAKQVKLNFQKSIFSVNITPKNAEEETELAQALKILYKEDKNLNLTFNKTHKILQIDIMGKIHAEIIKQFLLDRFNLDANFSKINLIYKETPIETGYGSCSYTGNSAVDFSISPLPKGSGICYKNSEKIIGKMLERYLKQIERLVKTQLNNTPYGWQLTDALITLENARYDSIGSEPMHYNVCVPIAIMRALTKCKTKLLEPLNTVTITAPKEYEEGILAYLYKKSIIIKSISNDTLKTEIKCDIKAKICEEIKLDLTNLCNGLAKVYSTFLNYTETTDTLENSNRLFNTKNETTFVQTYMNQNIKLLDKTKKRKAKIPFALRKQLYKDNI